MKHISRLGKSAFWHFGTNVEVLVNPFSGDTTGLSENHGVGKWQISGFAHGAFISQNLSRLNQCTSESQAKTRRCKMKSFSFVKLLNAMVNPGDAQSQRDADAELCRYSRKRQKITAGLLSRRQLWQVIGLSARRCAGAFNGGGKRCRCCAYRCSNGPICSSIHF